MPIVDVTARVAESILEDRICRRSATSGGDVKYLQNP